MANDRYEIHKYHHKNHKSIEFEAKRFYNELDKMVAMKETSWERKSMRARKKRSCFFDAFGRIRW